MFFLLLKYLQQYLPGVTYVNLYGPTEITGVCTYHIVDRDYENDQTIPIGKAFKNSEVFLLDEDDKLIHRPDITGEICVKGSCLSLGYYNFPEKTEEVFVQNPLNPFYPRSLSIKFNILSFTSSHGIKSATA